MDEQFAPAEDLPLPEDDGFTLDDAAELTTDNWWFWVIAMPLLLGIGFWLIRRAQINGPAGFEPELPSIFYERLQRWAERLGISAPTSHTPYEQAQHLSRALPEGRTSIASITEQYVRYRFSRRALPASLQRAPIPPATITHSISESSSGTLTQDWQLLEPLLWKKWLRKLVGLGRREKNSHFALKKGKSPQD
jgi:hypothetical protein